MFEHPLPLNLENGCMQTLQRLNWIAIWEQSKWIKTAGLGKCVNFQWENKNVKSW